MRKCPRGLVGPRTRWTSPMARHRKSASVVHSARPSAIALRSAILESALLISTSWSFNLQQCTLLHRVRSMLLEELHVACNGSCWQERSSGAAAMVHGLHGRHHCTAGAAGLKERSPLGTDISPHGVRSQACRQRLRQSSASWFVDEYRSLELGNIDSDLGFVWCA